MNSLRPRNPPPLEDRSDESASEDAEWQSAEDGSPKKTGGAIVADKDEEEDRLEKLLFGDDVAYERELKRPANRGIALRGEDVEEDLEAEDGGGFRALDDDQLFFLDAGPTTVTGGSKSLTGTSTLEDEDDDFGHGGAPAWVDSDDEKLTVSLASVPRLRKLRVTEDEDLVGGREYIKRLRRQFRRLNGTPEWARWDAQRVEKRRRNSEDEDEDEDDMDIDDEDANLRAAPMRQMLQEYKTTLYANDTVLENGRKRRKLKQDTIDIQRMKDVPGAQPSTITSLSIHSTLPILLSSGPASTIYLHHLSTSDPNNPNPLLTSLHVKRSPLTTTAFHPDPTRPRIFFSARRRYFHVWDLNVGTVDKISRVIGHDESQRSMERFKLSPDGKHMALVGSVKRGAGVLNVLNATSMQWVAQVKIDSRDGVADFSWWRDGTGLCIVGKNGEVTEFDLKLGRTVARWVDEGAVGTTTMCLGGESRQALGGDRWVVIGSTSGIVNIYDRRSWTEAGDTADAENNFIPRQPKPKRTLDQLVTPISHLAISLDGQLLVLASRWKRDALRLIHLPSCTVYKNWPTSNTPLGRISAVAWARPDAAGESAEREGVVAVLVVGNEAGKLRLWEVRS